MKHPENEDLFFELFLKLSIKKFLEKKWIIKY